MAKGKHGLGRGLAELLGVDGTADARSDVLAGDETSRAAGSPVEIPIEAITRNPRQPRRTIDAEGLEELARSIESVGVVQPVIVRAVDDGYELIAGERRLLAAQIAGFTAIPAIIREASDTESLEIALIENVVRQELNPVDEALALRVLLEDLGVTQESLAARVGKSRPALANKIRLLDLSATVLEMVRDDRLSEGHGRALLSLADRTEQVRLARRVVERGMSVRQVEAEVKRLVTSSDQHVAARIPEIRPAPDLLDEIRDRLYALLGSLPTVRVVRGRVRVELSIDSPDALDALVARLRDD